MYRLGSYIIRNVIHTTGRYVIYAATGTDDPTPFMIKTLTQQALDNESLAQLQHEHYLLERLYALSPQSPKAVEFINDKISAGIAFEDEGYRPLSDCVSSQQLRDLNVFFPIAIQLVEVLVTIHNANIIHKHLTPFNIFYNLDTKKVQIYDFSIATELNRTMVPTVPPRLLQGTLEYMAPEQTGRMNRTLTQRADLYSLGIIFYEWLTGSVPFKAKEPMTVIFGHIATIPKSPHDIDPTIPKTLSNIVMKLLSKPAEDRYKGAVGLEYDLKKAYLELKETATISDFTLAEKDISMRLELPDKLYGREESLAVLYHSFHELCEKQGSKLMTISGYSGIGKTSLVRELIPKIALAKGFFAAGKFDKFQQSDTYEGLRGALDKVVRYHLSLPEAEYQDFKRVVTEEMGAILSVITDFIPRLKAIVGEQEPTTEIGIEATKNRFELAIRRFVKIASRHHPLVLFLDDMQWANNSMFELLRKLVVSEDVKNLLIIVSYRSNEVTAMHPLMNFLEKVSKSKQIEQVKIEGLTEDALSQLLQDMLYLNEEQVASLSHLMEKKTEGNPFFLLMLLEELYREEELFFDITNNCWAWDESKIMTMAASDNVLSFVTHRIENLPEHVKNILHLAACIGNTFTIEDLVLAQVGHAIFLAETLHIAIQEGLILPTKLSDEWTRGVLESELNNREYRFQHDKIQQSCYETKTPEESKKIHLQLARNWYEAYKEGLSSTRLMAIADQFDKGLNYIADAAEKDLVCRLNYDAGKIALQSAAYEVAYQYDSMAKSLLNKSAWDERYELTIKVHLNYIKSSFLSHHFKASTEASEEALKHANNDFDKARILSIGGDLARATGKTDIRYYEDALCLLGYPTIAKNPNKLEVILSVLRFKFYIHFYSKDLSDLPKETGEKQELIYLCAERLAEECYFSGNILRWAYVFTRWSIETYTQHSVYTRALAHGIYCIIWPRKMLSRKIYEQVQERLPNATNKEMAVGFYFAGTILHSMWHKPCAELADMLDKAIEISEESGNLEFLAQSYIYRTIFLVNLNLSERLAVQKKLESLICDISERGWARLRIEIGGNEALFDPGKLLEADPFKTEEVMAICEKNKYSIGIYSLYAKKFLTYIHLMKFDALLKEQSDLYKILPKINKSGSCMIMLQANFYLFILEVELYERLSLKEKFKSRLRLYSHYRQVKSWVKFCPENILPYHMMMKAEYQRLKGNLDSALILYDETIRIAREYGTAECASLASQRALTMCVMYKKLEMSKPYADMAVRAYEAWGAFSVVSLLKDKYKDLMSPELTVAEAKIEIPLTAAQKEKQEERARYALDVRSIVFAADAINKEIHLDALLNNVMQLLVENIGATKSALCLIQKGSLWVEGFYDSQEATTIQTLTHTYWQEAPLSQEVLLAAWREQKEVILLDVSLDTELNASEYFAKAGTKCLIACPIIRGSHVVGIIYCENNISTNAFTPERIDTLRALSIQMSIAVENSRLYTTFEKFVPKPFLSQLGQEFIFDIEQGDSIEKHMNVLFMDIRNFTGYSEAHSAEESFKFINEYLYEVTPAIHDHHGFVDKFLGDGIMALFPTTSDEALQACLDMQKCIKKFSEKNKQQLDVKVGMGLHYGPLMLGIVGETQHIEGTVIGDTVNVSARIESFNKLYGSECLVSDSVKKRLLNPEDYQLRQIGQIMLLGRKEATAIWQVLRAINDDAERQLFLDSIHLFEDAYQHYLERQFDVALRDFQRIVQKNPQDRVAEFYSQYCQIYIKNPPHDNWSGEIEMTIK